MSVADSRFGKRAEAHNIRNIAVTIYAFALVATAAASEARAGSLTRTTDVNAPAGKVWSAIGGFCAIKDWHPLVGVCVTDGKTPPTRTLVTKDGKISFVETEVARNNAKFLYSYTFVASPLPAPKYVGTISVKPKDANTSTIVWHGDYTAESGKDKDVEAALANVYDTGLAALKAKFK
jgi:Polyketide cyclase / dehydrase and lipid transport